MREQTCAGYAAHQQGRTSEAQQHYHVALQMDEADVDALYLLSMLEFQRGDVELALSLINRALNLNTQIPAYHDLQGLVLQSLDRADHAQAAFEHALMLDERYREARYHLAILLKQRKYFALAIENLNYLLERFPEDRDTLMTYGNLLGEMGRHSEAAEYFKRILRNDADDTDVLFNLANTYQSLGQIEFAERCYRECLKRTEDHRPCLNNLGELLRAKGCFDEAILCFERILQVDPSAQEATNNLAVALREIDQTDRAASILENFLQTQARLPSLWNNLGTIYKDQGRITAAMQCFSRALEMDSSIPEIHSNSLLTMQYLPELTQEDLYLAHVQQASRIASGTEFQAAIFKTEIKDKTLLRVGYVSADFRDHAVARFIEPVIDMHDRERFKIFCYYSHPIEDEVTLRIKQRTDVWVSCDHMPDDVLANKIAEDQIDILVDLSGHSAAGRLRVFAMKPVPIQVSYLGYIATTGLSTMDYRLTHEDADPPASDAFYTERLYRLDGRLWWTYRPTPQMPEVAPLPASLNGYVTFGSTNNFAKINTKVIDTWAEILYQNPQSRLLMIGVPSGNTQTRIRQRFLELGVASERLLIYAKLNVCQYYDAYRQIDIVLDPWPYNGGTTSCDALWMGVPVVSLAGEAFVSRMGYALLKNLDLTECIANSVAEYVQVASNLASNIDHLAQIRRNMRTRLSQSPLRDEQGFTTSLENAYHAMWRNLLVQRGVAQTNAAVIYQPLPDRKLMKTFLHVGCGPSRKQHTTPGFNTNEWKELRFDIDKSVEPDIVGTMLDMSAVPDSSVDAVYSSHNIEHLYPHEVTLAMSEFRRVLKDDGYLIITCPDLQAVCQLVAEDKLTDVAYTSPLGPISPIDILFGLRSSMEQGNLYMAHRCGFTLNVLLATLRDHGFTSYAGIRRPKSFELWAVGSMRAMTEEELQAIAKLHFLR